MNDLGFHLFLFLLCGTVIVVISVLFAEPDDKRALAVFPRRWLVFFAGCAAVAVAMLVLEHTLASIH